MRRKSDMKVLKEFKDDTYANNGNMTEGLDFDGIMELFKNPSKAFDWCHQEKNKQAFISMLNEMSNFTKGIWCSEYYLEHGKVNPQFKSLKSWRNVWEMEWSNAIEEYDFISLLKKARKQDPVMYRAIAIDTWNGEEVDYEHPGHCWAFSKKGASNFKATSIDTSDGVKCVYLKGTTPWDNIDWIKSVLLVCTIYNDEREYRVIDDSKVNVIIDTPESKEAEKKRKEEKRLLTQLTKFNKHLVDNGDGTFDFNGDFLDMDYKQLLEREGLPKKLNKVNGNFTMQNVRLSNLNNFPREVTGSIFLVTDATSLEGFPQTVGGDVVVTGSRNLKSLVGLPKEVNGDLVLRFLDASSEGCPISVGKDVHLMGLNWTDLKGSPRHIGGALYCDNIGIISLEGMTSDVDSINLSECYGIYDLKGCPSHLKGNFEVFLCVELKSYEGMPQEIDGNVRMQYNHEVTTLNGLCKKVGGRLNLGFKRDVTRDDLDCEVGGQIIINGKEI